MPSKSDVNFKSPLADEISGEAQIYNCRKRNVLGYGCCRIGATDEYCRSLASRRSVRNCRYRHVHDFGNCRILVIAASLGDDQAAYELDVFRSGHYQLDVVFYSGRLRAFRKRAGVNRLRAGLSSAHAGRIGAIKPWWLSGIPGGMSFLQSGARHCVAVVAAVPVTLHAFMRLHLEAMASVYPTTAICGGEQSNVRDQLPPSVAFQHVPIQRKISPLRDLVALWALIALFRRERYTLVHSITPKAGLLAMCAAYFCGVPFRVHVFTGQVWATRTGLSRYFLKTLDRLIAVLATHVLADSTSQRQFLIDQGVVRPDRIKVLAEGSICGVDAKRFKPAPDVRSRLRAELQLPDEAVVALFLGRLTRDKGVLDLANAFVSIVANCPDCYLLVVGPDEECLTPVLQEILAPCADHVRFVGMTNRPEDYMAVADIFCLPSYREGFGSVIIEAAATGVPAVASRIYGLTDAVDDGETGLLHAPADVSSIDATLRILVSDADLRARMGARARERAVTLFSSARIVAAQMAFYEDLLGSAPDRGV